MKKKNVRAPVMERQPTEQVLAKLQQERELLTKVNEQEAAREYVEWFGGRHQWPEEDVLEVVGALGLNQLPRTVLDIRPPVF